MDHIRAVREQSRDNVVGIIVGRAIYEQAVTLEELFAEPDSTGIEVVEW